MGAGHDVAANLLADRLRHREADVDVVDMLSLAPMRQGDLLRGFYKQMISRVPEAYDFFMRSWAAHPRIYEKITTSGSGGYERGLLRLFERFRPDLVLATYNLTAQLLGRMRAKGMTDLPVVSYITDPGAHPYWVAPQIDAHLVPLDSTAEEMRALGAPGVRRVAPVVDERFSAVRATVRGTGRELEHPVVIVNGGSWGIGRTLQTARVLASTGARPLVVCGRSAELYAAVGSVPGAEAIGWTDDMVGLIAKADLLVDNAGGMTCWEALASGLPVVVHNPIAGHGRLNAVALAAAGLAVTTHTDAELRAAIHTPPPDVTAVFDAPDAADEIAAMW